MGPASWPARTTFHPNANASHPPWVARLVGRSLVAAPITTQNGIPVTVAGGRLILGAGAAGCDRYPRVARHAARRRAGFTVIDGRTTWTG